LKSNFARTVKGKLQGSRRSSVALDFPFLAKLWYDYDKNWINLRIKWIPIIFIYDFLKWIYFKIKHLES
jgi:hypothetical protein